MFKGVKINKSESNIIEVEADINDDHRFKKRTHDQYDQSRDEISHNKRMKKQYEKEELSNHERKMLREAKYYKQSISLDTNQLVEESIN